jgi:nicotinate dehydrogenase subunit A
MDLRVNGQHFVAEAPPNTKAMFVLRNDLGFHDVRQGCGSGHCGACTVLVDGRPASTCDMPIWALESKEVTTVRGLGSLQNPHPVQTALLDEQAGQCGYCLSGIMATAAALLASSGSPSEAEVRTALDRHLCRCGTHDRIIKAVMRAIQCQAKANASNSNGD